MDPRPGGDSPPQGSCCQTGCACRVSASDAAVAFETQPKRVSITRSEPSSLLRGRSAPIGSAVMVDDHGFTPHDAVLLLGQVAEARCTQLANPKYTYVTKIAKRYLPA